MSKLIHKAFASLASRSSKHPNIVSTAGQLSTWARTFRKQKGTYGLKGYDIELTAFTSELDDQSYTLSLEESTFLVNFIHFIDTAARSKQFSDDGNACYTYIMTDYASSIKELHVADMVAVDGDYFPTRLEFKLQNPTTATDSDITLWFANSAFLLQYDDYDIEIIPPFEDIDQLFLGYDKLVDYVEAHVDTVDMIKQAQERTDEYPYTALVPNSWKRVYPSDSTKSVETTWLSVIWGNAGNNLAIVRQATIDYIMSHTTHSRSEWEVILPGLFKSTEFTIIPFWDLGAVPQSSNTTVDGTFSPLVPYSKILPTVMKNLPKNYKQEKVISRMEMNGIQYRSLAMAMVGGPDNLEEASVFSKLYPDYMNVPSMPDGGRMSHETQTITSKLVELFKVAETAEETSDYPIGITRLERDGNLYVTMSMGNILFLCIAGPTYLQNLQPENES